MKPYIRILEDLENSKQKQYDKLGYYFTKGKEKSIIIPDIDYWRIDKKGDIDYELWFNKLVTSPINIKNNNTFLVGFFGDFSGQTYEYASISLSEKDLYELLRNWDMQEAIIGYYNKNKKLVKYVIVYPFTDGR